MTLYSRRCWLADQLAEAEDASLAENTHTNRVVQRDPPKLPILQQSVTFEAVDVSGLDRWVGADGVVCRCPRWQDGDSVRSLFSTSPLVVA
jgi:hypothetical protein